MTRANIYVSHNKCKQLRAIHCNDATRHGKIERQIFMSIRSRQSTQASDELYSTISRQPSLSQLYSDAAAYEKLLTQTGDFESSGKNSFAAFVDLDSTDADSILSRSSKL